MSTVDNFIQTQYKAFFGKWKSIFIKQMTEPSSKGLLALQNDDTLTYLKKKQFNFNQTCSKASLAGKDSKSLRHQPLKYALN